MFSNGKEKLSFGLDTFDAYRKDIAKRLKQKEVPQIDILLVVNMFLTGFDSKPLTFYRRTKKRDREYELIFAERKHIDGKRIHSTMYGRTYVD